jgi:ATP-dependent Lhr-like helicase
VESKTFAPPEIELLPARFRDWFAMRGWSPRPHQIGLLERAAAGRSTLLIAPTGAGKTLAGFLPSLVALSRRDPRRKPRGGHGLHTLYVSPLKALAVDIRRNLTQPVEEMKLDVRLETRTGDTPAHRRQRQQYDPPDILLTTPEQVALLIAARGAERFFTNLDTVIFDELHAIVTNKRGDLLSLGLARLRALAPNLRTVGLSATVADPDDLRAWLVPQRGAEHSRLIPPLEGEKGEPDLARRSSRKSMAKQEGGEGKAFHHSGRQDLADLITVEGGAKPNITILKSAEHVPWAGHSSIYALGELYAAIRAHKLSLLFVNTRSQAERIFQELWRINADGLPIALHHGSLDAGQRRKVETAMAAGTLRAVVCTSTLDLGIDWGDVDLVVNIGAPKGASRLAQRIGRANHRLDEPSKAILVPASRFEILECRAALDANYLGFQDTPPIRPGALDVLAQHTLGRAVAGPFSSDDLFDEVRTASPYRHLERDTFDRVVDFVATGGYALRTYERYAKIRRGTDGLWRIAHPRIAQRYRLNVGTIIETPLLNVRLVRNAAAGFKGRGGKSLGKIEEYFLESMAPGDTFLFAGLILRFEGIHENEAIATRTADDTPKIPIYAGGKFPLTTFLADGVRALIADRKRWPDLPGDVEDWLKIQARRSIVPRRDQLLIETFPRGARYYMVCYPFEGRLAHQTLGMLLTRRLERARLRPLGFVATDYSLAVWGLRDVAAAFAAGTPSPGELFDEDMLGDDLEAWMAESWLLKRSFRNVALISGLVDKRHPGEEKTGRQVTVSTDLIYDVLRRHEPDHILLQATWADASAGLLDVGRLGAMLSRIKNRIVHKALDRISPLAIPVMLEIGKERVEGEAREDILREAAADLIRDAMGDASS